MIRSSPKMGHKRDKWHRFDAVAHKGQWRSCAHSVHGEFTELPI